MSKHDRIIFWATLAYLAAVSGYMIWHQVFFSPDRFFVFAFLAVLFTGRALLFLWDWLPPLLLIFGYEFLRGLVPSLIANVHIHAMIIFDRTVFRSIPTIDLQNRFFSATHLHWYDYTAVVLYLLHFIVPMLVALVFWFKDRGYFKRFMAASVVLFYLGFITYYLFPAMPPWMASQLGYLGPVTKIINVVTAHFGHSINAPTVYQYLGANLVAAVPSLHAAWPLLAGLFVGKKYPRAAIPFFAYVIGVWLSVVYLGEHYVFDVLAGIVYAAVVYGFFDNTFGIRSYLVATLSGFWAALLNFIRQLNNKLNKERI
jgi:hypothetical protein